MFESKVLTRSYTHRGASRLSSETGTNLMPDSSVAVGWGVSLGCGVSVGVAVAVAVGIGALVGLGEAIEVVVGCGAGVADAEEQATDSTSTKASATGTLKLDAGDVFTCVLLVFWKVWVRRLNGFCQWGSMQLSARSGGSS